MADISQINLPNDNTTYDIADLVARGLIWQGTQAQYDAITTKDPNVVYFITDATGTSLAAVAMSGSYNDLTDKPTIDTSLDTTSSNAIANGPVASFAESISSTVSNKMDKANPSGTGTLSMNLSSATGGHAVALGLGCTASGDRSVAEGYNNEASGATAHAENSTNKAIGNASHVEGYENTAKFLCQHVFGMYAITDPSANLDPNGETTHTVKGNYIEIVGKGTSNASRSNARTLDWSGNEVLAGGLKINGNQDVGGWGQMVAVATNASSTITMTSNYGFLFITRGLTAQAVKITVYAIFVQGSTVNYNLLTDADSTVTLSSSGSRQLIISTTAQYGIGYRFTQF